ncbi:MAG TPA: thiolase domain-containing protein, partial [Euryarchaeota archaeon]|nr:thiolase domain-containing protein [Euryarchaeota archaeon]
YDTVLVAGVEKMTSVSTNMATEALAAAADDQFESSMGLTFPGVFGIAAVAHMQKYGTIEEDMARVAVKAHKNASTNPFAQFQKEIDLDTVLNAPKIAEPLGVFDCFPVSDGAAALILADIDTAKEYCSEPIRITGSGQGSDTLSITNRSEITMFGSTIKASKQAYDMAGVSPSDIDVAEVHDSYTIAEIIAIEDLGFFPKGEGGRAVFEEETSLEGSIPVNTSGGLKARGHPFGATGIAQINEIVLQLRNKASGRQVKDARIGLAQNMGGTGGTSIVHILEVD